MLESQLVWKDYSLEDKVESIQDGDENLRNEIIRAYQPFIAKSVSAVCKRYIKSNDDEYSIGMIAFNDAIELYSKKKGASFLSFAQVIIKRKIIDYIRKENRRIIPLSLDQEQEEELGESALEVSQAKKIHQLKEDSWYRKQEILELQKELSRYKISFKELTKVSPKHKDARESAFLVAKQLIDDPELKAHVLNKKRIPIKKLLTKVSVSKKTLERNRKYILTIFIILTGDFMYLKEYLGEVSEWKKEL